MRAVRLIVGFPPGGPTDTAARPMAQWLSERLGEQFVVERSGLNYTVKVFPHLN